MGMGPQIWAAISSPIFEYICKQGYGAQFIASISQKHIHVASFGFVDDVDLLAANASTEQTQEQVVESLKGCLNSWGLGLWVSGGATISPQKLLDIYELIGGMPKPKISQCNSL